MSREIVWTTRFKKDYKLAMKRHMNMDLIDDIIRALSRARNYRRRIGIMRFPLTGLDFENAIFYRTGF